MIWYDIILYDIISYHIIFYHIISYHIMSCHIILYHITYHFMIFITGEGQGCRGIGEGGYRAFARSLGRRLPNWLLWKSQVRTTEYVRLRILIISWKSNYIVLCCIILSILLFYSVILCGHFYCVIHRMN